MREERFSLLSFYERRVRRILPALFVVLAACLVAGGLIMLPKDAAELSASAIWALASASNIQFYLKAGYFADISATRPLLHTWSLAIEEQYYLLFPPFLFLIRRLDIRVKIAVIAMVALASLAVSMAQVRSSPDAAFYLLPSRAWELLLGSLAAIAGRLKPAWLRLSEILAAAGLALIAFALATYDELTPFPGLAALPPCLGAALIIVAGIGSRTAVGRVLSAPPFVWIGLISYSLYLWHWPLVVFGRYYLIRPFTPAEQLLVVAASFVLAWFSYRFVETPFRRRTPRSRRWKAFAGAGVAAGGVAAACAVIYLTGGLPQRLSPEVRALATQGAVAKLCQRPIEVGGRSFCETASAEGEPTYLVWGDSHASALIPAFEELSKTLGQKGVIAANPGCPPLLGVEGAGQTTAKCDAHNAQVLAYIRAHPSIERVVLVGRWGLYSTSVPTGSEDFKAWYLVDRHTKHPSAEENLRVFDRGVTRTLEALHGSSVAILTSVPEVGYEVPNVLARKAMYGSDLDIRPRREDYLRRQALAEQVLAGAKARGAKLVDLGAFFCRRAVCDIERDGTLLYRDDDHVSPEGARRLAPMLRAALFERGP